MTALVVLVTGSRHWRHIGMVGSLLDTVVADAERTIGAAVEVTVAHGNRGNVDLAAHRHARLRRWSAEPHNADWEGPCGPDCRPGHRRRDRRTGGRDWCPAAGPYRNARMVEAGADVVVALILDHSPGATGCLNLAVKAGIRGVVVYDCACHTPDGRPIPRHKLGLFGGKSG